MSDLVKRLRDARNWFNNDGQCCGQVDSVGTCAAPACIFGEALNEFYQAADRIAGLERDFARAEEEMKIADLNRIHFQKELEKFMAIVRDQAGYINELRSAIYRYVNHVVSCEGVSFTDVDITDADKPWAKLIEQVWDEVNKEEENPGSRRIVGSVTMEDGQE